MQIECDRFMDHVRERINDALIAEIEAERQAEEHDVERILYGVPGAEPPRGILKA